MHSLSLINARIRDIENKLTRIRSGEYNLRCIDQVRTALGIILVQLEEEKYNITYN
jgi:hypothetical protein